MLTNPPTALRTSKSEDGSRAGSNQGAEMLRPISCHQTSDDRHRLGALTMVYNMQPSVAPLRLKNHPWDIFTVRQQFQSYHESHKAVATMLISQASNTDENEPRYLPAVVPYRLIEDLQLTEFGYWIHTVLVCTLSSTFPQGASTFETICPSTPRRKFITSNQSTLVQNACSHDWRVLLQGEVHSSNLCSHP
jgi:hypothetical protein